ncbi:hypothetical protein B7755_012105 [Streptomyces sp. NBS 14/10]|uniref:hypothetical protein n=1 Tax=Streptomyces sp. NBS 14/10 TaxID=1945643 RepID=UPI000B9CE4AF|nr:hypothetical protein [Streptomyces sp. NBS 14/10]KAK1178815.1 hypothetical protein B7755_012105 [Streptomyces sp. NBS 14/10]
MSKAYVAAVAAATVLAVGGVTACGASDDSGKDGGRSGVSDGGGRKSGAGAANSGDAGDAVDSGDAAGSGLAGAMRDLSRVASATGPVICWDDGDGKGEHVAAFDDTFSKRVATYSEEPLLSRLAEIAEEGDADRAFVRSLCGKQQYRKSAADLGVSPVSPDGRRVAVEVVTDEAGALTSSHVGWLDLATGEFTDITEAARKGGYSPEKHSDAFPGFAPDGSLWFLRDEQVYYSADENGSLSRHPISKACHDERSGNDGFYRPVNSAAVTCPRLIHPSGKFAVSPGTVIDGIDSYDGFDLDLLAPQMDRLDDDTAFGDPTDQMVVRDGDGDGDGDVRDCDPVAWINADDVLCEGASDAFFSVRADASELGKKPDGPLEAQVKAEIAPETDNEVLSVAMSADRQYLYIASEDTLDDGGVKLYRAGLTSPGEPEELGPLPQGVGDDFVLRGNFQTGDFQ